MPMKRNWTVIRVLLEQVEAEHLSDFIRSQEYARDALTADPDILLGHIEILIDAGILKNCSVNRSPAGGFDSWDLRAPFITMAGHDLLDALRDATVWNSIKERARKAGISLSWEFIKAAIPAVMRDLAG